MIFEPIQCRSFSENKMYPSLNPKNNALLAANFSKEWEYIFEKKFKYNNSSNWTLPPHEQLFTEYYQFENFQQLKQELNNVKSKLNDYGTEEWSAHTRKQDPCAKIPWIIKQDVQAEFVTVAWCKFFECLHRYPLVNNGNLNSVHLCEAPGAFIAALNHYLHSTYDEVNLKWLATTLNPYYEGNPLNKMIVDIRFMLHTLDNWIFYDDFSGNIMNRENIECMAKECEQRLGEVQLVTADGSVDCKETPDNQEEFVSALHFSEICAALLILSKGGSFVLKMFTLFEALSVSVMFFLNCVFKEVNVFKPATSKRGNSEVYVICLNYKRPDNIRDYLDAMLQKVDTGNILPLFPKRYIPTDFCIQHEVCCRRFMHEQINAIESNICAYNFQHRWEAKKLQDISLQISKYFVNTFYIKPIAPEKMILQSALSKIQYGQRCSKFLHGSHAERQWQKHLSNEEQIFLFCKLLNEIERTITWEHGVIAFFERTANDRIPMKLSKGKPINKILSSLFACVDILNLRAEFKKLYRLDPLFENNPHCALGDTMNPGVWSIKIENHLSTNIAQQQRIFFMNVLRIIIDHQPKRVTFTNIPFLTHYSVSILRYLSANVFETCRMSGARDITLEIEEFSEEAKQSVLDIYEALTKNLEAWSFVDIMHLHRNSFSKALIDFNNQLLIHNYKETLNRR